MSILAGTVGGLKRGRQNLVHGVVHAVDNGALLVYNGRICEADPTTRQRPNDLVLRPQPR